MTHPQRTVRLLVTSKLANWMVPGHLWSEGPKDLNIVMWKFVWLCFLTSSIKTNLDPLCYISCYFCLCRFSTSILSNVIYRNVAICNSTKQNDAKNFFFFNFWDCEENFGLIPCSSGKHFKFLLTIKLMHIFITTNNVEWVIECINSVGYLLILLSFDPIQT